MTCSISPSMVDNGTCSPLNYYTDTMSGAICLAQENHYTDTMRGLNGTCLAPWNYNALSTGISNYTVPLESSILPESATPENRGSPLPGLWKTFQKVIQTLQSFDFYGETVNYEGYKEAEKLIPEYFFAEEFYKETEYVGGGSENLIFKAKVSEKHPEMPKDMEIAIRIRQASLSRRLPDHIAAYARLSHLVDMTPYIPRMYGAYYANATSFNLLDSHISREATVLCTEMEYVQQANRNAYDVMHSSSAKPRILFEEVIGTWAVRQIAKCNINDLDGDVERHHLQEYDSFPTVYKIQEFLYRFPSGLSPRKIDYDVLDYIKNPGQFHVGKYSYIYDLARGTPWEKFVTDINSLGLFEAIKAHFTDFQISETEFENMGKNRTYFSINEM